VKQKPSVIIFDLGKVLLDFDYSIAARKIGAVGNMSLSDVKKYLCESDVLIRFETGKMSAQEFFDEIRAGTGFAGTFEQFSDIFQDIFTEIPLMIELHAMMRRKGIPTYIFSNTNDLQLSFIRKRFPFFENFNGYILSYEVGAMKPHPKIYEAMEAMSGKRGCELLYIDDRAENIEAGAKRGWQTILQETPEKTRAGFEKLGLLNHI
jgi:HAD superfamily hydrolase (TIGR01509 family)